MTSNSLKKIQTFHNPKILYKPTIPTQPKTKPTKMAFLVPPPSKPKPFQFPPLYRFNPLNITQNSIHLASNARFTHNSLKDRLYSQRRDAKIKRARPIVCAASIPLSGGEKDSNFGRILLSDVVVKRKRNVFWGRKWNSLDIGIVFVVAAMHLLCILAPSTFNWGTFGVAVGLYVITGLLGITLSFHRNLSHRSFKLPKWLEYLFAYCGSLALQGHPIQWVSTHRYHHQFCDSERDPHSPIEGFWFSHMSWLFDTENVAQRCGEQNNVGDLEKQPFYKFLQNTYILHHVALGALLYAMGGFPYIVWGMGVRTVWVYHITWLVNSACHVWGKQAWNTGDLSRNNWWVAVLAFGEGWHNNHHAFEYSARHGLEWWQIDMTWYAIRVLEAVGLATDVKLPTPAQKQKMAFAK